jgi:transglutaminase-like putative cysteine protease
MRILSVRHITTYRYKQPVGFGEHRMMLCPRDDHDQRLLELNLAICPKPAELRWSRDDFGNPIAIARFSGRAASLRFDCSFRLEHSSAPGPDIDQADFGQSYPFIYGAKDMLHLLPFIERGYADPEHRLGEWADRFLRLGESTSAYGLLKSFTRGIHESFKYKSRPEKGIQDPLFTLKAGSGSCRDLAVLMIEAVRSLGMAARFVSGYLHVRNSVDACARGGNTHAWAQVFLPGSGWVDFDPSCGVTGNRDLIRAAVACDPSQAIPLQGVWIGRPTDNMDMAVEVQVSATDAQETERVAAQA